MTGNNRIKKSLDGEDGARLLIAAQFLVLVALVLYAEKIRCGFEENHERWHWQNETRNGVDR